MLKIERLEFQNAQLIIVCREAVVGNKSLLHAVIEMVESRTWGTTHRKRCTGGACKPPKGAVVKSHGIERLGKGYVKSIVR